MKQILSLAVIGGLWLVCILACTVPQNKSGIEQSSAPAAVSPTQSRATTGIDAVLSIPAEFKPVYKLSSIKDVSFAGVSRKVVRSSLPVGLDRATVELNLKQAVKDVYEKQKPDAIEVFAYKAGEATDGVYSVGHCTFAPYGAWERAQEKPLIDKYQAIVEVRDTYFNPSTIYPTGTNVVLQTKYSGEVEISNSSESWGDENVIGRMPNGTVAKIMESKEFAMPPPYPPMIRYKVTTTYKGKTYAGWVGSFNIKIQTETKE